VNVGRSILHSGTVGAALTASQLGISALAVSLRTGSDSEPWESAAELAVALIPLLSRAPARTVLNLNVPALPLHQIRGLRWARVSGAGLIKAASGGGAFSAPAPNPAEMDGPAAVEAARAFMEGGPGEEGEIVLSVGSPLPRTDDGDPGGPGGPGGLSDPGDPGGPADLADPSEDATLVARGYAALTALRGPRADEDRELFALLDSGLAAAVGPLGLAG
jgi:hypothetical protein